jgi:DNA cross-link repair 1A protein
VPFDTPTRVLDFEVTFISAEHCPGAAMLLFKLPDGRRVLHTGDMRFAPCMLDNPHLKAAREAPGGIDELKLDTTYGNPRHGTPHR